MSIQTQINRITNAKTAIATSIANKGVTVPSGTSIDGMSSLIDSIPTATVGVCAVTLKCSKPINQVKYTTFANNAISLKSVTLSNTKTYTINVVKGSLLMVYYDNTIDETISVYEISASVGSTKSITLSTTAG